MQPKHSYKDANAMKQKNYKQHRLQKRSANPKPQTKLSWRINQRWCRSLLCHIWQGQSSKYTGSCASVRGVWKKKTQNRHNHTSCSSSNLSLPNLSYSNISKLKHKPNVN